ncbi:MAG: hypothetical protein ACD_75C02047G0002 [uncultured bacterium]|nr:MAG: hypothetical protein ACD_75C02047G0002 [uncultured bacterium]
MIALTPFLAQSCTVATVSFGVGSAVTTRSTAPGISVSDLYTL